MKQKISQFLDSMWYGRRPIALAFVPLSWLFGLLVWSRKWLYRKGVLASTKVSVPVIIVGNITVGGTGKTPLVAWLANFLKQGGYKPGVISRGYGGIASVWPQQVRPDSDPRIVGDEAKLLARHCACPIAVGPERAASAQALIDHHQCDVIISDDGLQHYALQRDIEIALVDGERRYGNQYLLPAGPLREPVERLDDVDLVVCNGLANKNEIPMKIKGDIAVLIQDEAQHRNLSEFLGQSVHAVAGIGNPSRFFSFLKRFSINFQTHVYVDHHHFQPQDIQFDDDKPVLMTEKDAVKCSSFVDDRHWFVPIRAELPVEFGDRLLEKLRES